jgi:ubiquinone/menaquinone biosynthesis C-methylase UbiE
MKCPELEYYERIAPKYDELHAQPIQLYHTKVESELIRPYLHEGQRVAVIGCGGGREFEYLLREQITLVGVDFSGGMLDKARKKIQELAIRFSDEKLPSRVSLIQADAANLPFGNSEFDLVLCLASLNYFPNYEKSLLEMSRVTKPGGKVIITVINRWELTAFVKQIPIMFKTLMGRKREQKIATVFRKTFTIQEIINLYHKAGLRVCRVEGIRLLIDLIPQAWNTEQAYFPKAQKAIRILSLLDKTLLRFRFWQRYARFLMLVGEKPYA